jgi:hypothetical protein
MTNAQMDTIVLTDGAGNYFLVPRETLERGRVPEEQTVEIARLLAAAEQGRTDEDDAEGYIWPYFAITFGAIGLHYAVALAAGGETAVAPTIDFPPSSEPTR